MEAVTSGFCALFGAFLQELGHWYEVRGRVSSATYVRLMASREYWIITFAMIVSSAVGTVLWKAKELSNDSSFDFVIFGAAFPLLFKKVVAGIVENKPIRLGRDEFKQDSVFRTYFAPGARK